MWTDFHCHCLPGVDDGAADVRAAARMLKSLADQKVSTVVASPHFCFSAEKKDIFLKRREKAFRELCEFTDGNMFPKIRLGAEVVLERGLADRDLRSVCVQDTNLLLLELPYGRHKNWFLEEIENIAYKYSILPVMAHFERYGDWFSEDDYKRYFMLDYLAIQVNVSSLGGRFCRKLLKRAYEYNKPVLFGSDAHDDTVRPPNFDIILNHRRLISKYRALIVKDIDKLSGFNTERSFLINHR